MIVCGEQCTHQKDGYCVLEGITIPSISAQNSLGSCGYFAPGNAMGVVAPIGSVGPLDELAHDEQRGAGIL